MEEVVTSVNLEKVVTELKPYVIDHRSNPKVKYTDTLRVQGTVLTNFFSTIENNNYNAELSTAEELFDEITHYIDHFNKQVITTDNTANHKHIASILATAHSNIASIIASKKHEIERHHILSSAALTHDLDKRLLELEEKLSTDSLPNLREAAEEASFEIKRLVGEIQSLASNATKEAVYGNYKNSAALEKNASDLFRNLSIAAMLIAAAISLFFVFESFYWPSNVTTPSSIALRIFASILLSVPAAYLARESSKHRRQQYLYQQYALNLDALSPFIAELDKAEKNTLKTEIARKLFTTPHESGNAKEEPYPINANELLALLINKIELKSPSIKPGN